MCRAYEVTLAKVTVLNFWQENEKVLGKNARHSCLDLRGREREREGGAKINSKPLPSRCFCWSLHSTTNQLLSCSPTVCHPPSRFRVQRSTSREFSGRLWRDSKLWEGTRTEPRKPISGANDTVSMVLNAPQLQPIYPRFLCLLFKQFVLSPPLPPLPFSSSSSLPPSFFLSSTFSGRQHSHCYSSAL